MQSRWFNPAGCLMAALIVGLVVLGILAGLLLRLDVGVLALVPAGIACGWLLLGAGLLWRLKAGRRPAAGPPPVQRFCPACGSPVAADATRCERCLWPV